MDRSNKPRKPGPAPDSPSGGLFNSGMGFHSTPDGGKRVWAMVGLGSGELNPMAIAAIGAAISIFFIFGACVISVHGNVAWSFAVFLLAFLQGACATALAFYESASQRTRAITDLHSIRTTTAQIVESAPRPIDGG